jgi:beta-barrel assembly-enhancing protease
MAPPSRLRTLLLAAAACGVLIGVPLTAVAQANPQPAEPRAATAAPAAPAAAVFERAPGARPEPQSPEHGLWLESADAEREAMRSAVRVENVALRSYVRDVQCRVVPRHCADIRVQVFRRAAFNAFVMPNGYTEVWTGLLLRVENEAQLAFVLAHEGAHFTGNHSLRQWETMKRMQGTLLAVNILGAFIGAGDLLGSIGYVIAVGQLFAYSREFEEEADQVGQAHMARAGYNPREAADVWRRIIRLDQASDNERIRNSASRGSIFRTHPLSTERLATLDRMAGTLTVAPGAGVDGASASEDEATAAARYRAVIRPFLMEWLRDEMRGRDYGALLALLTDLRTGGDAGTISYFEGEVYRLRRQSGDDERAITAYQAATREADGPPEAFRELGTALNRSGDREGARAALTSYLERAPEAPDRALVQRQIERLAAAGAAAPDAPTAPTAPSAPSVPPAPQGAGAVPAT